MTDVSVDILEGKDAYPADLSMSCKQAVTIARAGGAAPVRALRRAHHHRGPHYVDHLSDLMLRLKQQLGLTSIVVTHDLDLM
jgi:phospholipid/cholesterol/gamma-HCH transport system ATP-binding protein